MPGQGQVKGHNETFSHFGLSSRLDGPQRAHTHPEYWVNVHERYCMGVKGILKKFKVKVRSQKVIVK